MKYKYITIAALAALAFVLGSCRETKHVLSVSTEDYGTLADGSHAKRYTLANSNGASVVLTDFGARIISIFMPDRNGVMDDVIVGPDDLAVFEEGKPERFLGCTIGRFGNRINNAAFTLDGVKYELEANENLFGVPV